MSIAPYTHLVSYKQWADRGLYEVASQHFHRLPKEDATILLRILDHIHVVDRIFQHHLQGQPHPFQAPRSDQLPSLEALAKGTKEVDDWYVSHVWSLSSLALDTPLEFRFTDGTPARMTRAEIILHVCLHGTRIG
jgi:uncharacterized damage-inducible protein DinB